jgi:hypothetical protein
MHAPTFRLSTLPLVVAALGLVTPVAAFAQLTKAGVVTTLQGTATVTRAALTQPLPLKFRDDVFVQDRVVTGDDSVARILLGGKAIVTVRERSSLTIAESPGVSTVNVGDGRAAIAVLKERMKPGETIEIRTPNAVAGIRGTIVVVEVDQSSAQAGSAPATAYTTRFTVITGEVLVRQLRGGQPFGTGVTLGPNDQARFTGLMDPVTRALTPAEAGQLSKSFRTSKGEPPAAAKASIVTQSQALAVKTLSDGISNPGPSSSGNGSVKDSLETSILSGAYDRRGDQALQEMIRSTSGREALQDAQSSAQVLNSLSPADRQQLNVLLQQLRLSNSGPGSLNSGSGSSGSGSSGSSSGPGSGTITLPSGVQVILQNGKLTGSNSGSGSTSSGTSGHH